MDAWDTIAAQVGKEMLSKFIPTPVRPVHVQVGRVVALDYTEKTRSCVGQVSSSPKLWSALTDRRGVRLFRPPKLLVNYRSKDFQGLVARDFPTIDEERRGPGNSELGSID